MRRTFRWSVVLVALATLAGACSSDDEEADSEDTEEATGTTEPTETTETTEDSATTETTAAAADFEAMSVSAPDCDYGGLFKTVEAVDAQTVRFTLCSPDVAFPSKVAFSAFGIHPSEYLEETGGGGDLVDSPVGTGPFMLREWNRGSELVLDRYEDYWGEAPTFDTLIFRWSEEAAQRLVELQSGAVDAIDNVGTDDFAVVEGDSNLELVERDPLNVFYLGFNVDQAPFDNQQVRQAIAMAIDRNRIVDNFYPRGSSVAEQFLPPAIPGFADDVTGYEYDPEGARALLAEAGFPDGFDVALQYRDVVRGYLPQPSVVGQDIQAQLAEVGIRVTLEVQESGTFIDNSTAGALTMYMLGWGADYPDATNFLDYHFNNEANVQFGTPFADVQELLTEAAAIAEQSERDTLYAEAAALIKEYSPMVPIAHGGSAVAYQAGYEGAHASPLSNETFAAVQTDGDQFVWLQNGEPPGLYCADESDGEALRACEQINEALLAYEVGGVEVVPGLAEEYESNEELTEWTFTLREGVTFHDGTALDANDVVMSYVVQWDAENPLHVGRDGSFAYFPAFFGGYLNPPAEAAG